MNWKILNFPKKTDDRGNLTFMEGNNQIPFEIKRVFYIYGVPPGKDRGGHAHKECEQLFIPIAGSFNITLENSEKNEKFTLDSPETGMYVPAKTWDKLENISENAIILVLCSRPYEEEDYIKNYEEFKKL